MGRLLLAFSDDGAQDFGMTEAEAQAHAGEGLRTETIPLAADEFEREVALRGKFAEFWSTAQGEPRAIFNAFISATPVAEGIAFEEVTTDGVQGWWVRPAAAPGDRAILYFHGGAYVRGSPKAYRGLASQIASRTRLAVLVIDYPLAPEATVPTAANTALRAYRWLVSNGVRHIAVAGDSSGGGLGLVTLAQLAHGASDKPPVAAVVFSPWTDLALAGASMTDADIQDPLITRESLQNGARQYLGGADPRDPRASPLYGELTGLPPLLIQVGTDERLLDDSLRYAEAATRAGASVQLEVWQGMHHVFQLNVASLRSSRLALDRAARFLTTQMPS